MAEILLNLLGLDDLADYSEFIFEKTIHKPGVATIKVGSNSGFNLVQS